MWKFKSWKGKDKWLFALSMGVILCILAFPAEKLERTGQEVSAPGNAYPGQSEEETPEWSGQEENQEPDAEASARASRAGMTYEEILEQRVREILQHVDGVGTVDVMIVLKSSGEKVVQTDDSSSVSATEETDSAGGTRKVGSEEKTRTTVFQSGDGQNVPIIAKELKPELSGMIISASGGDNPTVRAEISAAMEALFDLPAHKIKVLKRVE